LAICLCHPSRGRSLPSDLRLLFTFLVCSVCEQEPICPRRFALAADLGFVDSPVPPVPLGISWLPLSVSFSVATLLPTGNANLCDSSCCKPMASPGQLRSAVLPSVRRSRICWFRSCSKPVCSRRDLFLRLFLVRLRSIPFACSMVREEGFSPLACGGLHDLLSA
jgi:hypothetical protein